MARVGNVANIDACVLASKGLSIEGDTPHDLAIVAGSHKNLIKEIIAIEMNCWIDLSKGLCIVWSGFNEQGDGMGINVVSATNQETKPAGLLSDSKLVGEQRTG